MLWMKEPTHSPSAAWNLKGKYYNTVQYNTVKCNIIQYIAIHDITMQCNTMPLNIVQNSAGQFHDLSYHVCPKRFLPYKEKVLSPRFKILGYL